MQNELHNQKPACDENSAQIMGRSLLVHAREVHRYAVSYCASTEANSHLDVRTRSSFVQNLKRMLKDMGRLMGLARDKGVFRFCNVEQIDAYIEAASDIIHHHEAVVDMPMLMN